MGGNELVCRIALATATRAMIALSPITLPKPIQKRK